jgi:hypothetical protein
LADQLQETATGMMILSVGLEMFGEVIDALAEQRHLYFGRSGIRSVGFVRSDDVGLAILAKRHVEPSTHGPDTGALRRTKPPYPNELTDAGDVR